MKNKLFFGFFAALAAIVAASSHVIAQQDWIDIGGGVLINTNYEYLDLGEHGAVISFTMILNEMTLKDVTAACNQSRVGVTYTATIDANGNFVSEQNCSQNCYVPLTPDLQRAIEFLCR